MAEEYGWGIWANFQTRLVIDSHPYVLHTHFTSLSNTHQPILGHFKMAAIEIWKSRFVP